MSSSETSFAGLAFLGDFLGLIENVCHVALKLFPSIGLERQE
jgi:hypothetical protein